LLGSVCKLSHAPPHTEKPGVQVTPHPVAVQVALPLEGGGVQVVPHAPQFAVSAVTSTQLVPHWVKGALQTNPQAPVAHVAVPLGGALQTCPHAPQLLTSLFSLTHVLLSHGEKLAMQVTLHEPPLHDAAPLEG
jgi:hypothetical protein